jgi:xylulokinase
LAGTVNQEGADQTGLKVGTPVAVGAVDALSEGISVGAVQPGDLMIMYGSTAFFILVLDDPVPDPRMWTVAGAFQGQYNLAAGMATTGSLTRWFRDEFAADLPEDQAYQTLFDEAAKVPPGSEGLLMLPYFSGERTPINDPNARGMIAGLSLAHKRQHLFRTILEGVAFGIRHNIDTFNDIGAKVKRVVAVGGGTKSRDWLGIVSSVAGVTQIVPELTIGASYGDAFLAGLAAGIITPDALQTWVNYETDISPDPVAQQIYESIYADYLRLYQNNRNILHRLADKSM